jgi:hypothetical protein
MKKAMAAEKASNPHVDGSGTIWNEEYRIPSVSVAALGALFLIPQ